MTGGGDSSPPVSFLWPELGRVFPGEMQTGEASPHAIGVFAVSHAKPSGIRTNDPTRLALFLNELVDSKRQKKLGIGIATVGDEKFAEEPVEFGKNGGRKPPCIQGDGFISGE